MSASSGGWSEFLAMGGYGSYVWSAYGLTAVILVFNTHRALRASREALQTLAREHLEDGDDTAP